MKTLLSRLLLLVGLLVSTAPVISYAAPGDKLLDAANPGLGQPNNLDPYFLDYNRAQGMAALSNGSVVVAWSERENVSAPIPSPDSPDGTNGKLEACFFRIYSATGTAVTAATRPYLDINSDGTGSQNTPMVAALTGGGFVITWNSALGPGDTFDDGNGFGGDAWARVYDNSGTAVSGTFRVNDNDPNGVPDTQVPRAVVGLSGGGFAILWEDGNDNAAGLGATLSNTDDFFLRVFAANGTPAAASVRLGGAGQDAFFKDFQAFGGATGGLVALSNNTVVVGWAVRDQLNNGTGVSPDGTAPNGGGASYFQVFNASGAAVSSQTAPYLDINANGSGSQLAPALAPLSGGGFAVVWNSNHNTDDGGNSDIDPNPTSNGTSGGDTYVRVYTNAGASTSSTVRVNDLRTGDRDTPSAIKPLTDGGFAIVWKDDEDNTGNTDDYFARAYNANGTPRNPSILIGGAAADALFEDIDANGFGMAALSDGGYAVAIRVRDSANNGTGTSLDGVAPNGGYSAAVRVFNADGTSRAGPFFPYGDINPDFSGNQNTPLVCAIAGGGFAVTWHSNFNTNDTDNDQPVPGSPSTNTGGDTYTRIFNNSGVALHGTVQAHGEGAAEPTGTIDQQDPFGILPLTGGNYAVVVRDDNDNTNNKDDIFLSIFEGVPAGPVTTAPTVTTAAQSAVTATSATLGGNVTADGGATVTERGIVWKTSTGPTTADNKVANGSGTGVFSATVNSLPAGTTVFVRAYAINSVNTSYGNEISFTTLSPTVTLSALPTSIAEAAGVSTITATLSAAVSTSTTVTLTPSGTATGSGTDYTLASTTITIAANQLTGTTTVTAVQDSTDEDNETVILDITGVSGGNGATESGSQQVTVTITDDDAVPNLSINDPSLTEGNSGSANLTFTVTLSPASGKTVTVNYATADGTATTGGSDYTATSGTLTFTPGQTTRTINVPVLGDISVETNETFFANLSGATNASIIDNQGLGTITNDDIPPDVPISLSSGALNINAGSSPGGTQIVLRFVAGGFLEIFDSTRTLGAPAGGTQVNPNTVRILLSSITSITLTGSNSADVFTLDFSAGDICPSGGIAVNGGAPTISPGDLLVIDGDFTSGGAYGTGAPGAGTLTLDTGNTVTFTGLEPVDMSAASFVDFTVTVDPGNLFSGNVITTVAAVDAGVNTNISFGASGLESAKLGTVTGTLTINGDNVEHDYFVLQGLGTAMAGHFVVDALGGDSDVIEVNNTTFTVAGLNKNLSLKADFIGLGRVNATTPSDNPGVIVCSGNITLEADGDSAVATPLWGASGIWGPSVPTYFNSVQVPYTSRGTIQILGDIKKTAGADAALLLKGKHAVLVLNTTAATGTSPAGSIVSSSNKLHTTLHADSDASGAGNVMLMHRSVVTTNGGTLTIGGGLDPAANPAQGIAGATTTSPGVSLVSTTITTAGGALSIRGQGAMSSGGIGVLQNVSAGSVNCLLSTGVGGVTIVGTGGNNTTNTHGYFLLGNATAPALSSSIITTTGFITINGAAGVLTNDYVRISSLGSITSGSGDINFTASLAGHTFTMNPANAQTASVSSTSGNITIRTDKMNLNGGAGTESISTGTSNEVNLRVATGGVSVDLGSAVDTTASMLELSTAELDNISARTLRITSANLINVTAVISPLNFKTLSFDPVVGTAFTAAGGFTSDVTSGSVFERMIAGGTVNITAGAALTMNSAGGYVWNGTDTFTLLANDSTDPITGTFTGPTLTNFLGSTITAQQNYSGGSGNDLVFSRPNATVQSLAGTAPGPQNGANISWQIVFDVPVSGLTASNFAIVNGGLGGSPAITGVSAPGGAPSTTWNIGVSTGTGDGTLGVNLANDTGLSHSVTNDPFTGTVRTIDKTPPTVTGVTSSTANGTYKVGDVISIQVNFSEAVTVGGTPQLTLETGATDRTINFANGSGTSTLSFSYTVQTGDSAVDLDYTSTGALTLNGGSIRDAAQNDANLTLSSPGAAGSLGANKALVIDGLVPAVTSVNSSTPNATYKVGDVISIQVNFSEAVTVGGTPQLTLETGTTDRTINFSSGSGTNTLNFSYTVQTGDTTGDLDYVSTGALALNGGSIRDAAQNNANLTLASPGAAGSLGANKALVIDGVRPTATIVVADTSLTKDETSLVTITFNEAVSGFANGDLTIPNGLLSPVSTVDNITFTATFTPNNVIDANNVITLDNTGVTDLSGNAGSGSTDSNNFAINIIVVTITALDPLCEFEDNFNGTWRISRNGGLGNTTVQLQIDASSTAVAADWTQIEASFTSLAPGSTGTIVIPDGSTFVDITLEPIDDIHAEADETVRLNITADAAYVTGSPDNATVTISQNDFVVINTNDAGEGTLRQAVLNANAIAGTDTITFDAATFATAQTITLTSGQIGISSLLTVQGTGAQLLTLNGNAASRIFNITGGVVTLADLTVTNGSTTSWGGAISAVGGSNTTLLRCAVSNSTSQLEGGGIYANNGTLNVVSSTISGNTATTVGGGGIATGTAIASANVNVVNSTISGNTGANGGAMLFGSNAVVSIAQTTVTNNTSTQGPNVWSGGGAVTVANSIIAANQINTGHDDVGGAFTSSGGNLIGLGGGATGFTHGTNNDQVGTGAPINPLLGPLQDNGGPTLTHMLLNGSPAINNGLAANLPADTFDLNGNTNVAEALPVDQRGGVNLRTRGTAPDAGAVEAFAFEPTISVATTNEDIQSSAGLVITANAADGGLTTHYQISSILNGTLFKNDGTTAITSGSFITKAEGAAGLKFTPSANLNSPNTLAGFGFTAQAAEGTTAPGDLRGLAVQVAITVTAINDVPTVVAPGIPDQPMTIGTNRSVALGSHFADVDLHVLTYSVTGNTTPATASAVINGTNVDLSALAVGTTQVTIQADDSNGGTVTDTFLVSVGTANPTATMPGTPPTGFPFSYQTGLFSITVPVQNTTAFSIPGFRLHVDFSAYMAAHPSLRLYNATNAPGASPAYVDHPFPVAAGATVPVTLLFYTNDLSFPNPFAPVLNVQILQDSAGSGPAGPGVPVGYRMLPDRTFLLEWNSVAGHWYRVRYSSDMTNWFVSPVPIQAGSNRQQWIDNGSPFTSVSPADPSVTQRFYVVEEIFTSSGGGGSSSGTFIQTAIPNGNPQLNGNLMP